MKFEEWEKKNMNETVKDSGARRSFDTGAVRDIAEGKGRCDLLPLDVLAKMLGPSMGVERDGILLQINDYVRTGNEDSLYRAAVRFMEDFPNSGDNNDSFDWMLDVAKHYEAGAAKYAERNWEKGIPLHCYIDSGVRHYLKFRAGWDDEKHDRAFLWNMLCAIWTHENKPEMIDLPFAETNAAISKDAEGEPPYKTCKECKESGTVRICENLNAGYACPNFGCGKQEEKES